MGAYQHFILTKFNLGLYNGYKRDKNGQKVNNDQWMEHRIKLFEKYCYPSIKKQVNQNFLWLVLFDPMTPQKYLKRIKNYQRYENFCPVFGGWFDDHIKQILDPAKEYLITTRIDNDDAFHLQAIKSIQKRFNKENLCLLGFPIGYCLEGDHLFLNRSGTYSFLTLIEKIQRTDNGVEMITVRRKDHLQFYKSTKIKMIETTRPMWLQIIHEKNLVNQAKGKMIPLEQLNVQDFGI